MTLNKKKTWIIAVALAVVAVITIAALIPGKAKAYSEDYARKLAEENLPAEARMTRMEQDQEEYEFLYVDETAGQRYEIEISKTSGQIVKLEQKTIGAAAAAEVALSEAQARAIVIDTYPQAQILSVSLDEDDHGWEYEIRFNDGEYQGTLELQAATGEILEVTRKLGQRIVVPSQGSGQNGYLTEAEARSQAAKFVENAAVTDLDLEKQNGQYVYEIELYKDGVEYELVLNAQSGEEISLSTKWEDRKHQNQTTTKPDATTAAAVTTKVQTTTRPAATAAAELLSEAQIRDILKDKAPGGTVRELKLDRDDGRWEYEGEVITDTHEYDFEINAQTGAVLKWEQEPRKAQTTKAQTTTKAAAQQQTISSDKARSIVLAKIPGAAIVELEKDRDDGRVIYEGEAHLNGREYEFEIDAYTGTILKWETD